MKEASLRTLQDHQKTLTDGIQRLKKKIKELEDTLRSNETSAILQYPVEEENKAETSLSPLQAPVRPGFAAGSVDVNVLKELFGNLSKKKGEGAMSEPKQSEQMALLTKPSVVTDIDLKKGWYNPVIACVGSGQAWVRTAGRRLQLLGREGTAKRTVNIDFFLPDMAVTPQGDILLSDYDNSCIWSMSMGGNIKTLFNTEWKPWGICCLPSGDIVVAFKDDKRVVQYSSTGKIIREIDESVFQYPWYVAYSQVNQQLYVCDKSERNFYNASGRLLALDMNGRLQYTYTGSGTTIFTPEALCTNLLGHVLITDYGNDRVHILDKRGNFLQYLLTKEQGLAQPLAIDVDSEGYAWIGEKGRGKVKVVKYCDKK